MSTTTLRTSSLQKTTGTANTILDEEFEWDDDKAAANLRKHGITFEQARSVFRDPLAIELIDDRCLSWSMPTAPPASPKAPSLPQGSCSAAPAIAADLMAVKADACRRSDPQ